MILSTDEIRKRFIEFFKEKGHAIIPSTSLVTSDDDSVTNKTLFNSAGMQQLVPYLLGKPHPLGKRLANYQRCLRTVDIDSIGDNTHSTFFEMLGNWSLGDYFKEEAIAWSFEFLTSKEKGLGLDKNRLYVTVFKGDENAPCDTEAFEIWKRYVNPQRIYFLDAKSNWWEAGDNGPCGPDTEMFYDITREGLGDLDEGSFKKADDKRQVVEVWNDVFMQYEKQDGRIVGKLPSFSVDTGAGLERLAMVIQKVDNIYDIDILKPIMLVMANLDIKSDEPYILESKRIIVDHARASAFLIAEGVGPSNTGRGYILRRLIRRMAHFGKKLHLKEKKCLEILEKIFVSYGHIYTFLVENKDLVVETILKEMGKFEDTLERGLKEYSRMKQKFMAQKIITADDAYFLFTSYGLPIDLINDLAREDSLAVDVSNFDRLMIKHQDLSRSGAVHKFKGGLADPSDKKVIQYHTATHLLHQALCDVLGSGVVQKGSNITSERLRFDFSHPRKMTPEEIKKVEDIVNEKIREALPVQKVVMPISEAEKTGAKHFFGEKYGDEVSIYFIGDSLDNAYSKEFCGGPHVDNTSELRGTFKILKEEAVSAGVRRIKAVIE